jgi:cell division septum initiation protein DivIVA
MDVLVLIDKLDDLVHNAKAVPLTDQVRIDREEIYDILDQMRATIPEEIKQARWIVKERQEMLAEAKRECDRILGEAREQAVREASQTEIVKLAERQAGDIIDDARRQARETRLEMEDWADSISRRSRSTSTSSWSPSGAAGSGCTSARRSRRRWRGSRRREHERRLPSLGPRGWTRTWPSRASATGAATPTGRCPKTCSGGSSTAAA